MLNKLSRIHNNLIIKFSPIITNIENTYSIHKVSDSEWPVYFNTCTTDLRDFIGNIVKIENKKCVVKGVYRGRIVEMRNVIIYDDNIKNINDRIMITEHMDISGKINFIATKKRILSNLPHWINIGWSNEQRCRYVRIDIYTGEFINLESGPNTSFVKCLQ
jgi:hypothetical protein